MTGLGYTVVGAVLIAIGMWGVLALDHPLRKLLAVNVAGSGVFLIKQSVHHNLGSENLEGTNFCCQIR